MSANVKGPNRFIGIITPVFLLGLWEVAAHFKLIDVRFFPPPSSIVHQFGAVIASGELGTNVAASLQRLGLGMLLGGLPALFLGLAMGISRPLRAAIDPLISATYPIPKSAILPLVLLIFGLGEMSKVVMVALGAFYPIVINTVMGVANIDKVYLDVGQNYRANRWQVFRTIALPGALPSIMAGVKLAVGMGLILIAISEMVAANDGIGYMIWNAWQVLTVDTMYVGLLVIAVLGFLFSLVLDEVERRLIPWKGRA
ncbi:ABC transporter permease [Bradyrhizobium sp. AUGA SZCCT0042]|uniref:ABC transporter permease n=1 Tax=Bradyrhizobium sp. AUGA SZCCT0042 TaxID=2807651 RepID=UPI001BA9E4C6|nr:ABC transporter permease [Bradyrhizobium sp. AUGA SZCCT0042]MBR1301145.1 ABC transporter permease [Bradyrhizobium sp. AUGA SZCCT0042]